MKSNFPSFDLNVCCETKNKNNGVFLQLDVLCLAFPLMK